MNLKNILKKVKVKTLTQNFIKKLKRNSVYRPVSDKLTEADEQDEVLRHGWQ